MATLTMSHYIYLDRNQRYALNMGREVKVDGVSVPVWVNETATSEPAHEVFCRYRVRNTRKRTGVKLAKSGFLVDMPYFDIVGGDCDEELIRASQERLGTSETLLDYDDGGKECCEFRYRSTCTINGRRHTVVHFVEIKSCEALADTLA